MRMNLLLIALCSVVMTTLPRCIDLAPGATKKIKLIGSPVVAPEFFYEWQVASVVPGLQVEHSVKPADKAGAPVKHIFAVTAKADAKLGKYTLVFKTVGGKQAVMKELSYTFKVTAPKVIKDSKAKAPKAPRIKKDKKITKPAVVAPVVNIVPAAKPVPVA